VTLHSPEPGRTQIRGNPVEPFLKSSSTALRAEGERRSSSKSQAKIDDVSLSVSQLGRDLGKERYEEAK